MNFIHYLVGALPKLTWDSPLPSTLEKFLDDNWPQFESLMDPLKDILLQNDIYNIELVLRSQLPKSTAGPAEEPRPIEIYKPNYLEIEDIVLFLQEPFQNLPDPNFPEFILDYFLQYKTPQERVDHIEDLFISYFLYLQNCNSRFLRYYGRIATVIRTVLAAQRILQLGMNLEEHLKGDPYIVQTILENRSSSDLGLKSIFPEIIDIINLFTMEPVDLERDLDRIRFKLMEEVGQEAPFGDHILLSYIIGFQVRDIWNSLDKERGALILDHIAKG
jgi:hypothetical protein